MIPTADPTADPADALASDGAGPSPTHLDALRATLAGTAAAQGLVDVAYRTVPSPIGDLLVAATPDGVVRLAFATEDHDEVLDRLATTVGPRVLRADDDRVLGAAARQLEEYFTGRRRDFDLPLDLRLSRGFRRTVLDHLRDVPYGATATYTALAAAAGSPRAVRAAASACATNPVPIVVPCHRVVRSDGSLGGYLGGLAVKTRLLDLEAA